MMSSMTRIRTFRRRSSRLSTWLYSDGPLVPSWMASALMVSASQPSRSRKASAALTINALAIQLGTKGPSLYNHVDSLEDLRRNVRMRVIDDIIEMLNTVGQGRTRDDAVLVMAGAYRSYAHH